MYLPLVLVTMSFCTGLVGSSVWPNEVLQNEQKKKQISKLFFIKWIVKDDLLVWLLGIRPLLYFWLFRQRRMFALN